MQIVTCDTAETVRHLATEWVAESNCQDFGIIADVDIALSKMQAIINAGGVMLVAHGTGGPIGFCTVAEYPSPISEQFCISIVYWYVAKTDKTFAGPLLFEAARTLASERGYGKLLVTASNIASDSHDSICRFCERVGAVKFETIYSVETV